MGVYETRKCPKCKKNLKFMKQKTSFGLFGTPRIKCKHCSYLINTGKLLWRDIGWMDKFLYYLSLAGTSFFYAFAVCLIFMLIANHFKIFNSIIRFFF